MVTSSGLRAALTALTVLPFLLHVALGASPLTQAELETTALLFKQHADGSFGSLEETYQVVRTLEVIYKGKFKLPDVCTWLSKAAGSPPADAAAAAFSVKIAGILKCREEAALATEAEPVLVAAAKESKDLLPIYHAATGLAYIKVMGFASDEGLYRKALGSAADSLKGLMKSDGTWRYKAGGSQSSPKAAGLGLEAAAALIRFGVTGESQVAAFKSANKKLFDIGINDEGLPFRLPEGPGDEESGGSSVVASVSAAVKGAIYLAAALGEPSNVDDNIFESADLLLDASPNSPSEAYYQVDALSILNDNPTIVPLVVNMPSKVSLVGDLAIKVIVTTVLGSAPKSITVTTGAADRGGLKKCKALSDSVYEVAKAEKLGQFAFPIQVESVESKYVIPESTIRSVRVTGPVTPTDVKLVVFDADSANPDSEATLEFSGAHPASLSATHLQKLELSFKLTDSTGAPFSPQQVFVKFTHESGVEHNFVAKSVKGSHSLKLDFLELMDKLYYLSGVYSLELTVGDSLMENSFLWKLANVDLDLPAAPDTAPKPPPPAIDLYSRFGPKPEIHHVFRAPEKRPAPVVSYIFTGLAVLPLIGLLAGLSALGVNFKAFPNGGLPLGAALGFHGGIAAILLLYAIFWVKLNLFFTLKALLVLGLLTAIPGHLTLSYLANSSAKVKTL